MQRCFVFLREAILIGYLQKGQHIVERDLVDLLEISRTPVREAIGRLVDENLLEHYPHRGVVVVGFTVKDIKEMYDLRITLEVFLVRRVIESVRKEDLIDLRGQMNAEIDGGMKFNSRPEVNFHVRLLSLVKHRWLNRFLGQLEEYISKIHVLSFRKEGRQETAIREHFDIIDAMIEGDADRAEKLMRSHLIGSLESCLEMMPVVHRSVIADK
jgi:DNA-binding GntR family transcriptional regulator